MGEYTEPESYAAFDACGCLVMAVVATTDRMDPKETRRSAGREVARCIRDGLRIEPMTNEQIRSVAWKCATHKAEADREKAQGRLFAEPEATSQEIRAEQKAKEKIEYHEAKIEQAEEEVT